VTFVPSCSLSTPSVTTVCPADTPLVIAAWSCRRGYAWLLPALASVSVPLLAYQMSLFVDHRWAG